LLYSIEPGLSHDCQSCAAQGKQHRPGTKYTKYAVFFGELAALFHRLAAWRAPDRQSGRMSFAPRVIGLAAVKRIATPACDTILQRAAAARST